jgi:hypothetical protein
VVRLGGLVARKWCAGERGSAVFVIEKGAPLFRRQEKARSLGRSVGREGAFVVALSDGRSDSLWLVREAARGRKRKRAQLQASLSLSWVSDARRYENEVDGITTGERCSPRKRLHFLCVAKSFLESKRYRAIQGQRRSLPDMEVPLFKSTPHWSACLEIGTEPMI